MKSILLTALSLLVPMAASAFDFTVDGIYYNINDGDSTVSVTYGHSWTDMEGWLHIVGCYGGNVIVPQQVDYQEKTYVITDIGKYAFSDCENLCSVTIPSTVTRIGSKAFANSGVQSVSIPNSVTEIGYGAFGYCGALRSVILPERLTVISSSLFESSGLTSIDIPDSVTEIRIGAFAFTGLTSIFIPSKVASIGTMAFTSCKNLESIQVSEDNPFYDSRSDCNAIIRTASNYLITACDNTVIPDGIVGIGEYAFDSCDKITSVVIPASVTKIAHSAFDFCSNLTVVICKAITPPAIAASSFKCENSTLYVPEEALEAYRNADNWKKFSKILPIGAQMYGDANGDNVVNISDVNYLISAILGEGYDYIADVNSDGLVNITDINAIIAIILDSTGNP